MTTLLLMLIVPPLLGVLAGLFTTHLRRRRDPRDLSRLPQWERDAIAIGELHRWHAVWERDHPDLIVHSSYADCLPSPETRQFADGLLKFGRPYGGKKGGVDTSAMWSSALNVDHQRRFSPGGWIGQPRARPDPHPDPPCHHCIEVTIFGRAGPEYICNAKSPDEPAPDY